MSRGPLPNPNARRRNQPTIPTTNLPVAGRKGAAPRPPTSYKLGKAGKSWWKWAWSSPQAAAWDTGALYTIARRAQLEDDLMALSSAANEDAATLSDMLGIEEDDRVREVADLFSYVKRAAASEVSLMKEMGALDDKLGLSPAAMAKLRWKIIPDGDGAAKPVARRVSAERMAHISLVK